MKWNDCPEARKLPGTAVTGGKMTEDFFITEDGRGSVRINGRYYTMLDGTLRLLYYSGEYTVTDSRTAEQCWDRHQERLDALAVKAGEIARTAHAGQKDKAGADYIAHPLAVAGMCRNTESRIVALLHDTIEDTSVTADYLREQGFPEYLVHAVVLVTKEPDFNEEDYFRRIGADPVAREVKMADLMHNMDLSRLASVTQKDIDRRDRYMREYRFLAQF